MNKISGEWDEIKLKDLMIELDINDYDLSLTGFDTKELGDLIDIPEVEPETVEDDFSPDDVQEARLAAQYLFDHGATNLAVIGLGIIG